MGLSFAVLLGSFVAPAHAESIPKASYKLNLPQFDLPMVEYNFPSGLRMLFQEDHNQPIVAVTLVIDKGSDMDPPGYEGIAHVIEHLNFRAQHGDLPSNMDVVKQLGASFNATTFLDYTNYLTVAPKDSLIPLLRLEAVRLVKPIEGVTEAMVKTEVEVVRNELRMDLETQPGASAAFDEFLAKLYPKDHPYGHSTIGSHQSLDNVDLQAAKDFTEKNYRPEYATLVVVGDFDLKDTQKIINESFGQFPQLLVDPKNPKAELQMVDLPPRVDCNNVPEPPPPVDLKTTTIEGLVDKETATVAWSLPGGYCGIAPLGYAAAGLLNFYIYQTLVPTWEYKPGAEIPGVNCGFLELQNSSVITCDVEAKAGLSGEHLVEKIGDALYLQWDKQYAAVDPKRFDGMMNESKMDTMAYYLKAVDNTGDIFGVGYQTAFHLHFTGSPTFFSDTFDEWATLDHEHVEAFATKYLTRDRMVSVIVKPMGEEERARREAAAKNGENQSEKSYAAAQRDDAYNLAFDVKSLTPETIQRAAIPPDVSKITTYTLDNGMKVNIMPYGRAPLVRVGLLVRGGYRTSDPFGLDLVAERIVRRGTTQVERVLAVAGTYGEIYEAVGGPDNARILYADGSSGNIDALLQTIRYNVTDFDWHWADLSSMVKAQRGNLLRDADKAEWWTSRVGQAALFPNHPLGQSMMPVTWLESKSWPQSEVESWIHAKYQPQNSELFIVGQIDDVDALKEAIDKFLGSWKGSGTAPLPMAFPPVTQLPETKTVVVSSPKVTQTAITAQCQLPSWTSKDFAAGQILGDVLSERLWKILRERSGVTYGAYAFVESYAGGPRVLTLYALVQNNGVPLTLDTYKNVVADAKAGKFDDAAVATAKWERARRYPIGETSTTQMLNRLGDVRVSLGLDNDFFHWYPEELAHVSAKDLAPLVESCGDHMVTTIQGPPEYAEPALKERNVAYEVLDWEALLKAQMTPKEIKARDKAKAKKEAEEAKKGAASTAASG
jgi:zinc protease